MRTEKWDNEGMRRSFLPWGGMPGMPGGSWWGGGTPGWSGCMLPMLTMPSTGPCKGGSTGG